MLDEWALNNSKFKKRIACALYENRHLSEAACIHALSEAEADSIRNFGLKNPIAIVSNGVESSASSKNDSPPTWARHIDGSKKILLFLGRLHPKKGLVPLLKAWASTLRVAGRGWMLVIGGWDENNHRQELEHLVHDLSLEESVLFIGPQYGSEKRATLNVADAFVLPSFSEGVPMAVLEAWASGLPVLMTPHCNLHEGFTAGAALSMAPDPNSISQSLLKLDALDSKELDHMGELGRELVATKYSWEVISDKMLSVYHWLSGQSDRPDCVITQ